MLWWRDYSCFGMLTVYQAEAQKACWRQASWRKGPSGLILNDDEGCPQSDSNSNASQFSVEIHDVHFCVTHCVLYVTYQLLGKQRATWCQSPYQDPHAAWLMPSLLKAWEQVHICTWVYRYLDKRELMLTSGVLPGGRRGKGRGKEAKRRVGDKKIEEVRKGEKRGVEGRGAVTEDERGGQARRQKSGGKGRTLSPPGAQCLKCTPFSNHLASSTSAQVSFLTTPTPVSPSFSDCPSNLRSYCSFWELLSLPSVHETGFLSLSSFRDSTLATLHKRPLLSLPPCSASHEAMIV